MGVNKNAVPRFAVSTKTNEEEEEEEFLLVFGIGQIFH